MKNTINNIFQKNIIRAICLNIIIFVVMFLLFECTTKSDDYDMTCILYGAIDGEYSPFILYSNIIWGYILTAFMKILPAVSWYYVLQLFFVFVALTGITYIVIKEKRMPLWILCPFLLVVVYEFCIRITFTKTSGLLITCGYLFILYLIENNRKLSLHYLYGVVLIILGIWIRSSMFMLITEVFFVTFIVFLYKSFKEKRKCLRQCIYFITIVAFSYACMLASGWYSRSVYNNDPVWGDYLETNSIRASLFDYGIPDYNTYKDEYESLGVSYEDYQMWFKIYNRADDRLDSKLISDIRQIAPASTHKSVFEKLDDANHNLLNYLFTNTVFFLFILCCILLLMSDYRYKAISVIGVCGTCLFAYYYMYLAGRTQHQVDASVFFAGAVILLYYLSQAIIDKKAIAVVCLISCQFVLSFWEQLASDSYYGNDNGIIESQKDEYEGYKKQKELLVDDSEHLYLFNTFDTNNTYACFTPLNVIDKKFYHNIYRLNMNHIPTFKNVLSDFGVNNPLAEMVNSDTIYYYASNKYAGQMDIVLDYVRKNYCKKAEMIDVKWLEDSRIYRFYDDNFTVNDSDINEDNSNIEFSCESETGKTKSRIWGYIYEKGTDSFAQNVYLKVVDKKTGEAKYYMTKQRPNEELKYNDKYEGKYSSFKLAMEIPPREWKNSDKYILLENENGVHSFEIE